MLGFIYGNQTLIFVLVVVIILVGLYFVFKSLPTKVVKKTTEKKSVEKVTQKDDEKNDIEKKVKEEIAKEIEKEEKTQNEEESSKKEEKRPKIVQVFKRESRVQPEDKVKSVDPIYDRDVEFINTSKNIAKFKSFADETKVEEAEVKNTDEFGFVADVEEDCEFCEDHVKHFDHSRRMSAIMKDDNHDEMFASHISDKYLNINSDRHLNLDEKFNRTLFSMTEKMMNNSDGKFSDNKNNVGDSQMPSLWSIDFSGETEGTDDEIIEDEVKVNMKTALIAETYFNRRKKK